jgi:hypothetical protein
VIRASGFSILDTSKTYSAMCGIALYIVLAAHPTCLLLVLDIARAQNVCNLRLFVLNNSPPFAHLHLRVLAGAASQNLRQQRRCTLIVEMCRSDRRSAPTLTLLSTLRAPISVLDRLLRKARVHIKEKGLLAFVGNSAESENV